MKASSASSLFMLACLVLTPLVHADSSKPVLPLWPEGVPDPLRAGVDAAATELDENDRVANVRNPSLIVYRADPALANGTAVVLCPGGGYARLAIGHEGHDVARWFNSLGVSCFILKYRHKEFGHPAPLRDVTRALRLVRSRAAEFGVDPERIGVMGFSAGGHLASSAATLFDHADAKTGAPLDAVSARPSFAILIYPVIFMDSPHMHKGSRDNLIGENPTPELARQMSTDQQVTAQTPPTFLIHAQDDRTVPVENALAFYTALRRAGVPTEMHLYEKGSHGFGLKPKFPTTADWPARCETWLRAHGWVK